MKRYYYIFISFLIIVSCGKSPESELYDLAVEHVKKQLVSPSSAKFAKLDKKNISIIDTVGYDNPMAKAAGLDENNIDTATAQGRREFELLKAVSEHDNTPYSVANVKIEYEAQNRLGVMVQNQMVVTFRKYHWKDGEEGDWEIIGTY
ncbi:MAG: hypothetical protein KIT33_15650 [Candidatus Kapabacteria bacterium]|nr:hypothetical protein [Ignavibacteriota bacterium]MCW5886405.1 hypothetical protein [Candidatus Kapabacteria bacterium]